MNIGKTHLLIQFVLMKIKIYLYENPIGLPYPVSPCQRGLLFPVRVHMQTVK